jgi:putative endonuclease
MFFFVYILKSDRFNRYYIGQSENLTSRLTEHNAGKVFSTKPYRPWRILYFEAFHTRTEAIKREHFLKSPAGWATLKKIKEDHS